MFLEEIDLRLAVSIRRHLLRVVIVSVALMAVSGIAMRAQGMGGESSSEGHTKADSALIVTTESRVALMEYEAWFGPNAVTFANSAAKPQLQSADMASVGGGYDSADPKIIHQHVDWLEEMGVDGAIADLSNDVSCIFNSKWFVDKYLLNAPGSCSEYQQDYQVIRDNTGNLYPAWKKLGTRLKLVPLLGGIDENVLYLDIDGKTAFEKEIDYFGGQMEKYPNLRVIYEGKPLMLVFLGAGQDPDISDKPLWYQMRTFLKDHAGISSKYTFKFVAGYLDSQPLLWKDPKMTTGPVEISPKYGFWSYVDRLNTSCTTSLCPYYPSYTLAGARVENFTVSIATAGQDGWRCDSSKSQPYCPDDSLRFGKDERYTTFLADMKYAQKLDPIFLLIHQFNEFQSPDEGFNANTNDDVEPSNQWSGLSLEVVRNSIERYRRRCRISLDRSGKDASGSKMHQGWGQALEQAPDQAPEHVQSSEGDLKDR